MKIFDIFKKNQKNYPDFNLDFCVEKGVLTKEEKLRIERDRAIRNWEKEVEGLKKKEKKK
jgi:hypothetical protein